MKLLRPILVLAGIAALALTSQAADRKSPHETISTRIDGQRVTIVYGRPYTKSPSTGAIRTIWGGLVPWDKADRLGADEATLLITEKALTFGGVTIPAGAYTLYQIPHEAGPSTLAFSSALGKWGVPVDEKHDVARVDLTKGDLATSVDQLTIIVEKDSVNGGGQLKIEWEKTVFSAHFTVGK
jgi:hypothetical protein